MRRFVRPSGERCLPEGRSAFRQRADRKKLLDRLVARVWRHVRIAPAQLPAGSRRAAVTRARDGIAYLWVEVLGHPGRPLAPVLGVRPQADYQAATRGRQGGAQWERLLRA